MASLWSAFEYGNTRQWARMDSIDQALNRRRGQLAPLDRTLLDYQLAWRRRDRHSELEAMRRFVEIAPVSEFLDKAGQSALSANHPREAIEFLTQADPESGWLRGRLNYWADLSMAHHLLGEHREELAVARRARRLFPYHGSMQEFNMLVAEGRALAALGRTDEVQALLDEIGRPGQTLSLAGELLLHDHLEGAYQVLDRGIMLGQAWLSTVPTDTTFSDIGNGISRLAEMLLSRGRVDDARVLLERAVEERGGGPSSRDYIVTLGIIAGMQGDRQRALEIRQYLEAQRWSPSARALWQARIAAYSGELDEATTLVRKAMDEGTGVRGIHLSPLLSRALRDHPPFQELMRPKG